MTFKNPNAVILEELKATKDLDFCLFFSLTQRSLCPGGIKQGFDSPSGYSPLPWKDFLHHPAALEGLTTKEHRGWSDLPAKPLVSALLSLCYIPLGEVFS
jgi:hypothetical protein